MTEQNQGYAVFLFETAFEALGDAIKPYRQEGPAGAFIQCIGVDTGGSFVEMTLNGRSPSGESSEVELMIPMGMVRLIASIHSESVFGFSAGGREPGGREASERSLPPLGPGAPKPAMESESFPHTAAAAGMQSDATQAAKASESPATANAQSPADDRHQPPEG